MVNINKKNVFVVVLNWNGADDTLECIASIKDSDYDLYNIVVVDNASDDESVKIIKKTYPEVKLIECGENKGYAGGNNAGINYALQNKADYVWLLNNDVVVSKNALSEFVKVANQDDSIGILGSKILSYWNRNVIDYAGGLVSLRDGTSSHVGFNEIDEGQYGDQVETEYVTGASLFISLAAIKKIGLLDESYFLYYEETDYCCRASKLGLKVVYCPRSLVYHKVSASTSKSGKDILYYMTRNRLYFLEKNGFKVRWLKRFFADAHLSYLFLRYRGNNSFGNFLCIILAYSHWIFRYAGPKISPKKYYFYRQSIPKCS